MPQDIRISPDGKVFYVTDMMADGVYMVDGDRLPPNSIRQPRGSNRVRGARRGNASVSVIDFATHKVAAIYSRRQ